MTLVDPFSLKNHKTTASTSGMATAAASTDIDSSTCPVCGKLLEDAYSLDIPVGVCLEHQVCLPKKD